MKAIVTGGAGFIGSHLVELLLAEGHEVSVLDNLSRGRLSNLLEAKKRANFSFFEIDIRDAKKLDPLFDGVDWVFHLAGLADVIPSIDNPREYFEVNVQGTVHVLEASRRAKVSRFIYAASASCYGTPDIIPTPETAPISPLYPYAMTKHLGEELLFHWHKVYGLNALSLRLFNVYGPRSRTNGTYGAVLGVFLAQKFHNKPMTVVGDGAQTRDFTYVSDVASAFYKAAESSISGEVFNVGSARDESIKHLVDLLDAKDVIHLPKRPGEPKRSCANIEKIKNALGWTPKVSLTEGIKALLMNINDYKDAPVWDEASIRQATESWFQHLSSK